MTPEFLSIAVSLWETTLSVLGAYADRRVESGCLWYGHRDDRAAHAIAIGVPRQINRRFNFEIPSDALAALNAAVPNGYVVVAQVHTHPGQEVTHSPWDDTFMVSRRTFSIVLPGYAAAVVDPADAGVHVHDGEAWGRLAPAEAMRRLIFETASRPARPILMDTR